jgi:hypothetical protein
VVSGLLFHKDAMGVEGGTARAILGLCHVSNWLTIIGHNYYARLGEHRRGLHGTFV